jgi:NAD(P) transhydrogenase
MALRALLRRSPQGKWGARVGGEHFDFDLICLGSGPAGQRAAVQAAKLGKRVAVVEPHALVGGVSVETGTIPSKTLREAVAAFVQDPFAGHRGGEAQPPAKQVLARVKVVVAREAAIVRHQLARNGVTVLRGEGAFLGPHAIQVEGDARLTVSAAHILIAVGTRPAPPPGGANDLVITSDGLLPLDRLPRSITVVGGGVIGMEYASIFSALGLDVTIVDRRTRLLEAVDREICDELVHQMRDRNAVFRLGESVLHLDVIATGSARRVAIALESGKHLVSDMALFSVGRLGATDRLNMAAAGITPDPRGRIVVDERFRTTTPHILAAGDVIGSPALAATASQQGRLAVCYAFGVAASPMTRHFPVGIYTIPEISLVGQTEEELTRERVPYEVGMARYREIARGQILDDDTGLFKILVHRESRRLLGVHAIGTLATELIHVGQAVLGLGGGLDYFLDAVFNYPTLAECYKVAALDAANKLALAPVEAVNGL